MRKALSVAVMIGLLVGSLAMPAEAGKKKKKKKASAPVKVERTVEFDYMCPCTGRLQLGSLTGGSPNFGGGPLAIGGEERYVSITSDDASGTAVIVNISQDTDGDGFNNAVASICATGEKGEPAEVVAGLEMRLFIASGACEDGTPSFPMGGALTITLSNLP